MKLGVKHLEAAVSSGDLSKAEDCLQCGVNPNPTSPLLLGLAPLMLAVKSNRLRMAQLLLKYGATLSAASNRVSTPLLAAVQNSSDEMLALLLRHSTPELIDQKDMLGLTALMHAVKKRSLGMVERLINAGADMTLVNSQSKTALQLAQLDGQTEMAEFLQEAERERNEWVLVETP